MKLFCNMWYRFGRPPWVMGPRVELVELVNSGASSQGALLISAVEKATTPSSLLGRGST